MNKGKIPVRFMSRSGTTTLFIYPVNYLEDVGLAGERHGEDGEALEHPGWPPQVHGPQPARRGEGGTRLQHNPGQYIVLSETTVCQFQCCRSRWLCIKFCRWVPIRLQKEDQAPTV